MGYSILLLAFVFGVVAFDVDAETDPVGRAYLELTEGIPAIVGFSALTFLAVLVGSGLVRLVDRFMQMTSGRRKGQYSPLDTTPSAVLSAKRADELTLMDRIFLGLHSQIDSGHSEVSFVRKYVEDHPGLQAEWRDMADDERQFVFHLRQDQEFGALQSEQLLRACMLVPASIAVVLVGGWLMAEVTPSKFVLLGGLVALMVVLYADYARIDALMNQRWTSLADEYPTWIPLDYQSHRDAEITRIRDELAKNMDRINEAWGTVISIDTQRRRQIKEGAPEDVDELVGALTELGRHLTSLLSLPVSHAAEDSIHSVEQSTVGFRAAVGSGDLSASLTARGAVGEAISELAVAVRRKDSVVHEQEVDSGESPQTPVAD
jgi:hypothetical protein